LSETQMTDEDVLFRISTPFGPIELGHRITHNGIVSRIICLLCLETGKLECFGEKETFRKHLLKHDELKPFLKPNYSKRFLIV